MIDRNAHEPRRDGPKSADRDFDRILSRAAPVIEPARIESLVQRVLAATAAPPEMPVPPPAWLPTLPVPAGAVYLGLLILGGLLNLLSQVPAGDTPLDLLFSSNLLPPLGG